MFLEIAEAVEAWDEFLSTGELLEDDAYWVRVLIEDARRRGKKTVSSNVFKLTEASGARGDFRSHRLQVTVCGICRKDNLGHNRITCPFKNKPPEPLGPLYRGANRVSKV